MRLSCGSARDAAERPWRGECRRHGGHGCSLLRPFPFFFFLHFLFPLTSCGRGGAAARLGDDRRDAAEFSARRGPGSGAVRGGRAAARPCRCSGRRAADVPIHQCPFVFFFSLGTREGADVASDLTLTQPSPRIKPESKPLKDLNLVLRLRDDFIIDDKLRDFGCTFSSPCFLSRGS